MNTNSSSLRRSQRLILASTVSQSNSRSSSSQPHASEDHPVVSARGDGGTEDVEMHDLTSPQLVSERKDENETCEDELTSTVCLFCGYTNQICLI